jgi:predicted nucleotidyltransferase
MREDRWPSGGTPLIAGIHPPGFTPVTEEVLTAIVRRIVAVLHPEKVILFGSYAYGRPSDNSDVDLLVIMETTARPADRYLAVSRVIRPRPFSIDILVKTPKEIARALAKGDSFIEEIVAQGLVLYARSARSPSIDRAIGGLCDGEGDHAPAERGSHPRHGERGEL